MSEYKKHISSLKGIACLFIMLGHYVCLLKFAQSIPVNTAFLDTLRKYRLFFLVDEQF